MLHRLRRAAGIVRTEGLRGLLLKVIDRIRPRLVTPESAPRTQIRMLVRYEDAVDVDWTQPAPWQVEPRAIVTERLRTAWIMHPPGPSGGGHQNIFRFISFLEQAGHSASVHLYHSADHAIDAAYVEHLVRSSGNYADFDARFQVWDRTAGVGPDVDVLLATGWETAYPAYLDPSHARRGYFVQDFEPGFYPVGSEHTLAENTYRFGFTGLTAGDWLAQKLRREFGMTTHPFGFGADTQMYHRTDAGPRDEVFFYARPVTTRRGFELGVMALEQLTQIRPGVRIHLAGWDVSDYDLPFEYVNHAAMRLGDLNGLYNRCGVGLVLSLTNLSLLPLELLAAGVVPVVNEGDNNRLVSDNPHIVYAPATPAALARAMDEVLSRPDREQESVAAAASVADDGWQRAGRAFVSALEEVARG